MTCPSCSAPNHEQRRYCGRCGTTLRLICTQCAFVNDCPDRFCGGCGLGLKGAGRRPAPAPPTAPPIPMPRTTAPQVMALRAVPLSDQAASTHQLTESDLAQILEQPEEAPPEPSIPQGRVTQGELDRLFEGLP